MIGTYYYPEQWPEKEWARDFRRIRELGMRHVHMAEFSWCHLEPEEGRFEFDWLDRAIALAAGEGLKIILCTPTATPPIWISHNSPEALMIRTDGRRVVHGSRGHGCVNTPVFNTFAERITRAMTERYGQHPDVIGWQIDNEVGHYADAPCHCPSCEEGFQEFCRNKFRTIDALNTAWAGDFWSQNYQHFGQIPLPNRNTLPYLPNEHARLDFLMFFSESQARFLERQAAIVREHVPEHVWITHNYRSNDLFVHPRHVREGIDVFTITSYPVAGMYAGAPETEQFRIGDPVDLSFQHDYARGHSGRWGVMEQQPGQVNWGPYNCRPYPGAVRLWLWTAIAHGAEILDTYRYRQPRCGAEQYHDGLVGLDGVTLKQGGREFVQVAEELTRLEGLWEKADAPGMRKAAMIWCWGNQRALEIHPQTEDFDALACWQRYYASLKRLGFHVDVLSPGQMDTLNQYDVVCAPVLDLIETAWADTLEKYAEDGGHLVLSPRVFTRDRAGHFFSDRYAGKVERMTGAELLGYDVLPSGHSGRIRILATDEEFSWRIWGEQWKLGSDAEILAEYRDQFYAGVAAAFETVKGKGWITLIGFDAENVCDLVMERVRTRMPDVKPVPAGCVYSTRDSLGIFCNFNDHEVTVPPWLIGKAEPLIGTATVGPADVCVWELKI